MSVRVRVRTPSGKTEIWNLNMSESTLKWYLNKKKKEGYEIIQVLSGAKPTSYRVKTSPSNLKKVKRMYLENVRKSVYDPKNIEKLRAFGWSDEKIKQWQQETLKEAEERVKNPVELQKLAKYWIERGKIPGEVVISDIQVDKSALKPTPKKPGKLRAIQRAKENLKDPIPQPKPVITPKPTPKPVPLPTLKPKPVPISGPPTPLPKPTTEIGVTTISTPALDVKKVGLIFVGLLLILALLRR